MANNKLTVAVDFDGTIVEDSFPQIGKIKEKTFSFMRRLKANGHTIIIWTCREGVKLEEARKFMIDNKIPFDYINENNPALIEKYGNDCRKIGADFYLDDKASNVKDIDLLLLSLLLQKKLD